MSAETSAPVNNVWMITYRRWNCSARNALYHKRQTATVFTEMHPIAWRSDFLKKNPEWEGCNVLFAIYGPLPPE